MYPSCASCGLKYEREPGYFLGSIYVNYGLTALLVTVGYFGLVFSGVLSFESALWVATAFTVVFPVFFFRYARACGWASTTTGIRRTWNSHNRAATREMAVSTTACRPMAAA